MGHGTTGTRTGTHVGTGMCNLRALASGLPRRVLEFIFVGSCSLEAIWQAMSLITGTKKKCGEYQSIIKKKRRSFILYTTNIFCFPCHIVDQVLGSKDE